MKWHIYIRSLCKLSTKCCCDAYLLIHLAADITTPYLINMCLPVCPSSFRQETTTKWSDHDVHKMYTSFCVFHDWFQFRPMTDAVSCKLMPSTCSAHLVSTFFMHNKRCVPVPRIMCVKCCYVFNRYNFMVPVCIFEHESMFKRNIWRSYV